MTVPFGAQNKSDGADDVETELMGFLAGRPIVEDNVCVVDFGSQSNNLSFAGVDSAAK